MPPVRWKLAIAALCALVAVLDAKGQKVQTMPMTEDGWRPIVGSGREPQHQDEITYYRNPSQGSEPVKAETSRPSSPSTSVTIPPSLSTKIVPPKNNVTPSTSSTKMHIHYGGKVNPHGKSHIQPVQAYKGGHGPQIPLNPKGHRGPPHYKHHVVQKGQVHPPMNGKRHNKPVRGHSGPHRDEVLSASATSNIGSYAYYNHGPSGINTRIIHSPGHGDFNNFAPPPQHFSNQPIQQFFPKHPVQNDVYYSFQTQNDEYTRNLVPPPPYKLYPEKEQNQKVKNFYKKDPIIPVTEPISVINEQNSINKFKPIEKPTQLIHDNVGSPPHLQQQHFNFQYPQTVNGQGVDIQITKEKLKVFHNNIPNNYRPLEQYSDFSPHFGNKQQTSEAPKLTSYEVTEGKFWQDNIPLQQHFSTRVPEYQLVSQQVYNQPIQQLPSSPRPPPKLNPPQSVIEPVQVHFLPTPFLPDLSIPTLPTQSEVSTVYNEIAQINKQKPEAPGYFNIKEVSTHFPIVGRPQTPTFEDQYNVYNNIQFAAETPTTVKVEEELQSNVREEEIVPTAPAATDPPKPWQSQRNNNGNKRRRPNNRPKIQVPDTIVGVVTESYEAQKEQTSENSQEQTSRPPRPLRRRPTRYRTTERPSIEPMTEEQQNLRKRQRVRVRPTQQTLEEFPSMPLNHKMTEEDIKYQSNTEPSLTGPGEYYRPPQTTVKPYKESLEEQYMESFQKLENSPEESKPIHGNINLYDSSNPYQRPNFEDETNFRQPPPSGISNLSQEAHYINNFKQTTEALPTTNIRTPENEVYYTTPNYGEPSPNTITIQEIHNSDIRPPEETTTPPTTTTTTTTEAPTTPKAVRTKIRKNNYDTNRPRFSVKDYKQRLASTTSTTEKPSQATHSARVRIPNRFRKPIAPSVAPDSEEATEPSRSRFVPKDARHRLNQEQSDETTTEKQPKIYSTRVRSFNRYRSTTEAPTTTPKVSIKPNLFTNRRRPPPLSLKSRIQNKQKQAEETTTTKSPEITTIIDNRENEVPKEIATTLPYVFENVETTTEFVSKKITELDLESTEKVEKTTQRVETAESDEDSQDILRNESFMYSQRVSDLTSSAKYDQPGHFKAVSPNSRRVPSYFTIATDDPILPIEAFFPNLNSKE